MPLEVMPGYEIIDTSIPDGADSFVMLGLTDGEESWYGATVDKAKYRIVFENETEDSVYLKLVKIQ